LRTVAAIEAVAEAIGGIPAPQAFTLDVVAGFESGRGRNPEQVVSLAFIRHPSVNLPTAAVIKAVSEAWRSTPGVFIVDEAVATLVGLGWDAERLIWAIIGNEAENHYQLVLKESNRMARIWRERTAEDLIGFAWRGLRLALRSYSPEKHMFSTYACPRIRGSIRDGVRAEHHLPKRLTTFVNSVEGAREELSVNLGRHPSLEELSEQLGIDIESLNRLPHLQVPSSLDEPIRSDEGSNVTAGDTVADDGPDIFEVVNSNMCSEAVAEALSDLPAVQADVIRHLVFESQSIAATARMSGLTARQVRTVRDEAFEALKPVLFGWVTVI